MVKRCLAVLLSALTLIFVFQAALARHRAAHLEAMQPTVPVPIRSAPGCT